MFLGDQKLQKKVMKNVKEEQYLSFPISVSAWFVLFAVNDF